MRSQPCGSVRTLIADVGVMLRTSGALWLEDARTLVVADLHLEKGSAFAARGQMLPPYDTGETLSRLEAEVVQLDPATVILLGDTLHDGKAGQRIPAEYAGRIAVLARSRTLVWIVGNHDREGPQGLEGETADELTLGGLIFRHEPQAGRIDVTGHLHPCARVCGGGRSVRRRCFVTDGERLILPAFGAYAGGLNVRDVAFAGLFSRAPTAVALGRKAHPVRWSMLAPD
jgi:DNA ligase-associated metallophosphoesterase